MTELARILPTARLNLGPVGLRWDDTSLMTVVALSGRADPPAVTVGGGTQTSDTAPVGPVVGLVGWLARAGRGTVEVVTVRRRGAQARCAGAYDSMIGQRPAVGPRRTWLVLRLAPQDCLSALACVVRDGVERVVRVGVAVLAGNGRKERRR